MGSIQMRSRVMFYEIAAMIIWLCSPISIDLVCTCVTSCPFPKATVYLHTNVYVLSKADLIENLAGSFSSP